uniref:AGC-kinase C-terminal domain-containing protein n=1 Tax=Panagrellus redivivus TaxID=6233 RepID=A0A7E4VS49_PANRE
MTLQDPINPTMSDNVPTSYREARSTTMSWATPDTESYVINFAKPPPKLQVREQNISHKKFYNDFGDLFA